MVAANTTALSEACATSALAMVNERSVRRRWDRFQQHLERRRCS
jgi:hypothetical protein